MILTLQNAATAEERSHPHNGICNQEKLGRKLEIKNLLPAQAKETA